MFLRTKYLQQRHYICMVHIVKSRRGSGEGISEIRVNHKQSMTDASVIDKHVVSDDLVCDRSNIRNGRIIELSLNGDLFC
jgi:hypothetical protein